MGTTIRELHELNKDGNGKERGAARRAAGMVRSGEIDTVAGERLIKRMGREVPAIKLAFPSLF